MSLPPVYLDRDGVINRNRRDYVRSLSQWEPLPGSLEAIVKLSSLGFPVVVVTNQSAIARGYCTIEEVTRIHEHLIRLVEDAGGEVSGIYFCPHHPDDGCSCRKPAAGMIERAREELHLSPGGYMVGDARSDMEMGGRAGLRTVLVLTGRGLRQLEEMEASNSPMPCFVARDLAHAAEWIIRDSAEVRGS